MTSLLDTYNNTCSTVTLVQWVFISIFNWCRSMWKCVEKGLLFLKFEILSIFLYKTRRDTVNHYILVFIYNINAMKL